MKLYFRMIPALLSAILLAAHFFRMRSFLFTAVSLALIPLLFWKNMRVRLSVQIFLFIGALEWVRTMIVLAMERQALGLPWARMVLILGGVALFTAAGSMLVSPRGLPCGGVGGHCSTDAR